VLVSVVAVAATIMIALAVAAVAASRMIQRRHA
jgi:hypothetical protein